MSRRYDWNPEGPERFWIIFIRKNTDDLFLIMFIRFLSDDGRIRPRSSSLEQLHTWTGDGSHAFSGPR